MGKTLTIIKGAAGTGKTQLLSAIIDNMSAYRGPARSSGWNAYDEGTVEDRPVPFDLLHKGLRSGADIFIATQDDEVNPEYLRAARVAGAKVKVICMTWLDLSEGGG